MEKHLKPLLHISTWSSGKKLFDWKVYTHKRSFDKKIVRTNKNWNEIGSLKKTLIISLKTDLYGGESIHCSWWTIWKKINQIESLATAMNNKSKIELRLMFLLKILHACFNANWSVFHSMVSFFLLLSTIRIDSWDLRQKSLQRATNNLNYV